MKIKTECTIPKIWQSKTPETIKIKEGNFFLKREAIPHRRLKKTNPIIKPPLLPKRADNPPEKPEKTGNPIKPNKTYDATATVLYKGPK